MRGRRSRIVGGLLAGALGLVGLTGGPGVVREAAAQERDPAQRAEIISRYKSLLESNPQEGFIFNQLLKEVGFGQQLERLIEDYQRRAEAQPKTLALHLILGHLLKAARRYPEALAAYEAAAGVDGKSADAWLGKGLVLQLLKRDGESQAAFEEALRLEKNGARKQEILRKLADLAFNRRDWDAADRFYAALIELEPQNEYLRTEYAEALVQYKRYDKALEQYEALKRQAGKNVKARLEAIKRIGDVYALQGRYDEAVGLWRGAMGQVAGDSYLQRELEQRIIDAYRDKDDLPALIAYYEERWRSPSHDQAMTLAGLYDETGQEAKALGMYRQALKSNGKSVDARLRVIRLLERQGDEKAIIAEYKALIKAEPRQTSFSFELAEIYWRSGDKKSALATVDELARRFGSDPVVQTNVAELYMQWGARDKALKVYQGLVRIAPGDPGNLIALGEFHWVEGEREQALATWRRILTAMPVKHEAHAELAQVYADHNMIDEAVKEYEAAIQLDPDNERYLRRLAEVYERSRRTTRAIAAWEAVLGKARQDFTRREARSRIIQLHQQQGTLRAQIALYRKGFEATPPDLEAGYFLGEAWIALKDWSQAEATFQKLLAAQGESTQALLSLQRIYTETGEHRKNIEVLRKIAEADPLRAKEYYTQMAELSLKLYEDAQALELAKIPVDLNPNDANAHARLARVYRQMQDLPRAAAEYRAALDIDDQDFATYFELAEVYQAMDQVREAEALYRVVVRKGRDEGEIQRAGRRAIDINDSLGTLPELEKLLTPLLSAQPPRKVYGQLLIEVYDRLTRGRVATARYGASAERAQAERELAEISRRALGPLLVALNDDDPTTQGMAIRILGDLGNGNAAVPLTRVLEGSDPALRVQAALAVGRLGDPRAVQPMVRALEDKERSIRQIAAWSLGRMGGGEASKALERQLGEADWSLRALAAVGLGRGGDARAAKLLGPRLASPRDRDSRAEVRVAAAWGLGALGAPEAQAPLIEALQGDPDPDVRRMAAWALGNLQTPGALEALLRAYWTGEGEVREVAGKALLRRGSGAGRPPYVIWEEEAGFFDAGRGVLDVALLVEVLLSDEVLARPVSGHAVVIDGEAQLTQLLTAQLTRGENGQLLGVLYDLDQHDGHISLGVLTWQLPEEGPRRAQEVEALRRIGQAIAPSLLKLLASEDGAVRALAAGVLGKASGSAPPPGAAEGLLKALGDKEPEVRRKAALALGRLRDPRASSALLQALQDDYWGTRAYAAEALGRLGDKAAVGPLTQALEDPFAWVQASAATGLGALGDPAAVGPLTSRLPGADPAVKVEILRALARLNTPAAREALAPFRDDPDPRVREAVQRGAP